VLFENIQLVSELFTRVVVVFASFYNIRFPPVLVFNRVKFPAILFYIVASVFEVFIKKEVVPPSVVELFVKCK
jgi:hypothetical protein